MHGTVNLCVCTQDRRRPPGIAAPARARSIAAAAAAAASSSSSEQQQQRAAASSSEARHDARRAAVQQARANPMGGVVALRLRLCRGDISSHRACAVAVSGNATLSPNLNSSFWRFNGRASTNYAIHAAAGPELAAACAALPLARLGSSARCAPGEAVVTPSFEMRSCQHIIHAVCPDGLYGSGGAASESGPAQLRQTFAAVLAAADGAGASVLALPALGCGVQGWRCACCPAGVAPMPGPRVWVCEWREWKGKGDKGRLLRSVG